MQSHWDEWSIRITKEGSGPVYVTLCEVEEDGQMSTIDSEAFGPFDTALDITAWIVRHWAPRARLPLR